MLIAIQDSFQLLGALFLKWLHDKSCGFDVGGFETRYTLLRLLLERLHDHGGEIGSAVQVCDELLEPESFVGWNKDFGLSRSSDVAQARSMRGRDFFDFQRRICIDARLVRDEIMRGWSDLLHVDCFGALSGKH